MVQVAGDEAWKLREGRDRDDLAAKVAPAIVDSLQDDFDNMSARVSTQSAIEQENSPAPTRRCTFSHLCSPSRSSSKGGRQRRSGQTFFALSIRRQDIDVDASASTALL